MKQRSTKWAVLEVSTGKLLADWTGSAMLFSRRKDAADEITRGSRLFSSAGAKKPVERPVKVTLTWDDGRK